MSFELDILVILGRFQPVHAGHIELLRSALNKAQEVVVLVGSAQRPRCIRNPFSFREREMMLRQSVQEKIGAAEEARLCVLPVEDSLYLPYRWQQRVQRAVATKTVRIMNDSLRMAAIWIEGENNSLFSALPMAEKIPFEKTNSVTGKNIRNDYLAVEKEKLNDWLASVAQDQIPKKVAEFLSDFATSKHYDSLRKEYTKITGFIDSWHVAPYTPTFNTCDALLTCGSHVLLIQRDHFPGEGLWAMPGGFIDQTEPVEQAVLRELVEETGLVLADYRHRLLAEKRFDYPFRSARGRVFTQLFHFDIEFTGVFPPIKAADDARNAKWVALTDLRSDLIFEDHYDILDCMLNLN